MKEQKRPSFTDFIKQRTQETLKNYKRLFFPAVPAGYDSIDHEFLKVSGLVRMMMFSVFCFAFTFILIKASSFLILTGLLRYIGINHIYSIFNIYYLPGDESVWNDGKLLIVYGIPNLAFLGLGMYLTGLTVRIRKLNWIFRLVLAWLAFNFVVFFISELIAAIFFYKGFGIALQWVISHFYFRLTVILVAITGLVFWTKRFSLMFLRCSPSRIFNDDHSLMKTWLIWMMLIPVFIGSVYLIVVFLFNYKMSLITMFLSSMIILPLIFRSVNYLHDVRVFISSREIPGFFFTTGLLWIFALAVRLLIFFV